MKYLTSGCQGCQGKRAPARRRWAPTWLDASTPCERGQEQEKGTDGKTRLQLFLTRVTRSRKMFTSGGPAGPTESTHYMAASLQMEDYLTMNSLLKEEIYLSFIMPCLDTNPVLRAYEARTLPTSEVPSPRNTF